MTDRTELRRLLDEYPKTVGLQNVTNAWFELARAAVSALPSLLDQLDAAEAALARVRERHRESHVKVLAPACADEECDHEDACPLVDYTVCAECHDIGDEAHPYAYEEGGVDRVAWPCPTIAAIWGEQS